MLDWLKDVVLVLLTRPLDTNTVVHHIATQSYNYSLNNKHHTNVMQLVENTHASSFVSQQLQEPFAHRYQLHRKAWSSGALQD